MGIRDHCMNIAFLVVSKHLLCQKERRIPFQSEAQKVMEDFKERSNTARNRFVVCVRECELDSC
jgi:hypothetical protein